MSVGTTSFGAVSRVMSFRFQLWVPDFVNSQMFPRSHTDDFWVLHPSLLVVMVYIDFVGNFGAFFLISLYAD